MTEFELTELVYLANGAGNTALTIYMSIVSGYLVVAYAVGAALSRLQIVFVNSLFLFFASAFTYSTIVSFMGMRFYTEVLEALDENVNLINSDAENSFVLIVGTAMVAGIVGSLAFMWDVRRRVHIT